MQTARCLHGVLSLKSALVVAGGQVSGSGDNSSTNAVEVFKLDKMLWYAAEPLPVCLLNMSMTLLHNTCYVIGGYCDRPQCHVYYAELDSLLLSCEDQSMTKGLNTVWTTLPTDMPVCLPAAVNIAGNLLIIGGTAATEAREPQSGVYVYSPSGGMWNHIGDLSTPRKICKAIKISPLEVLVIGGWTLEEGDKNTVVKGRLHS